MEVAWIAQRGKVRVRMNSVIFGRWRIWTVAGMAALVAGLGHAWWLRWACDDAFISFRYARNLIDGLGLVYNAAERVEGYTNFLWTLLVAAGMSLRFDAVLFSQLLGAACYGATIVVLLYRPAANSRVAGAGERDAAAWGLPLAACTLAAHGHAAGFAVCGLETPLFMLLVTLTAQLLATPDESRAHRYFIAGSVAALATLTRPNGFLFVGLGGLVVLWDAWRQRRFSPLIAYGTPGTAILLPYAAWKLWYYGSLLPNTYFAKSAYLFHWEQGWTYVWLYLRSYPALPVGLIVLVVVTVLHRSQAGLVRESLIVVSFVVAHLVYVAKVGGDFMFARFCIAVTPLMLIGLERVVNAVRPVALRIVLALGAVVTMMVPLVPTFVFDLGNPTGIVEERAFYPWELVEEARALGASFKQLTEGTAPRLAIYGSQAMLAYYAEAPLVIEAHTGLTDATLAHREVAERGRVGHEKQSPMSYLRERGIDFRFSFGLAHFPAGRLNAIRVGDLEGEMIVYRRDLMRALSERPDIEFVDFEVFLDGYLEDLGQRSRDQVQADYDAFRRFYFDHNLDGARQQRFESFLGWDGPLLRGVESRLK